MISLADSSSGDQKIKVLMLSNYFDAHLGGIEVIAGFLARGLSKKGFEVTWIAAESKEKVNFYDGVKVEPVTSFNLMETKLGLPLPIWSLVSYFKLINKVRSSEIVLLHDTLYLANILALILSRLFNKRVLIVKHIALVPFNNLILALCMKLIDSVVTRLMLLQADKIVFYSSRIRSYYFQLVPKIKTRSNMIYNAVNDKQFFPSCVDYREELNLPKNKKLLLFVGRFVEKKGLYFIKKFADSYQDFTWVLVGDGPIDPRKWGLSNVIVYDQQDRPSLRKFYVSADLLVLPSMGEGFPLVIQEALTCGLPVLTTHENLEAQPELKDVVQSSALDVQEFYHSIIVVLSKTIIGNDLHAFSKKYWDTDRMIDSYKNILLEILK